VVMVTSLPRGLDIADAQDDGSIPPVSSWGQLLQLSAHGFGSTGMWGRRRRQKDVPWWSRTG
jgi:hypothetical protein